MVPKSFKNSGGIGNAKSSAPLPPPPSHPFLNPSYPTPNWTASIEIVPLVLFQNEKKKEKFSSITDMPWLETQNRNEFGLWII